jgi:putative DNA primase/helicase|uniref:AAA family ATPase n=1 Tax=Mariniflexile sp. TaxID=1979402 RepID=UPI004048325D
MSDKWFGHRVHHAPVVYVMLEGEVGLKNRVAALENKLGQPLPDAFGAVVQPFVITNPDDVHALIEVVPQGAVVVVDTLNRAAPTSNENAPEDMGQILLGAKTLADGVDGLVVLVHHTGKDSSKGMRGHSSLHAAVDAAIEVERNGQKRAWGVAKAKDAEDGLTSAFRLKVHELGTDEDGDAITSCTIEPDHTAIFERREPKGAKQCAALRTLKAAFLLDDGIEMGVAGCPATVSCMRVDRAKAAIAETLTTTAKNKRNNEAKRLVDALISGDFLLSAMDDQGDGWCWIAE